MTTYARERFRSDPIFRARRIAIARKYQQKEVII